jgi:hypothetical protein
MRINVSVNGQRVFSEGRDGSGAWELPQGAPEPKAASPEGAAALRHGVEQPGHFWTLADMPKNGHAVELAEREEVEGADAYVVKLTLNDGFESWYVLHPETCLVLRTRSFRAYHPDLDPKKKWVETLHEDYRSVSGVRRAFRTRDVDRATDKTVGTTRVVEVLHDPHFDAAATARR